MKIYKKTVQRAVENYYDSNGWSRPEDIQKQIDRIYNIIDRGMVVLHKWNLEFYDLKMNYLGSDDEVEPLKNGFLNEYNQWYLSACDRAFGAYCIHSRDYEGSCPILEVLTQEEYIRYEMDAHLECTIVARDSDWDVVDCYPISDTQREKIAVAFAERAKW